MVCLCSCYHANPKFFHSLLAVTLTDNLSPHRSVPDESKLCATRLGRSTNTKPKLKTIKRTNKHPSALSFPFNRKSTKTKSTQSGEKGVSKLDGDPIASAASPIRTGHISDGLFNHICQTIDVDYSILRFFMDDVNLGINADIYISAEDTIQAHTTSMKTCLDDFDTVFYRK
jgi:hypothetical protein